MAVSWSSDAHPDDSRPKLSLAGLRTLPSRLCSPPLAVGKARSCGVVPIYQVKLEDVLDNKLLPPLSLRDFEQYMLFVAGHPEFLYFALWLKDYTTRYNAWSSGIKGRFRPSSSKSSSAEHRTPSNTRHSPALASFFSRAQRTFFVPGSDYELDVPLDVLAPFASFDHEKGIWTSRHGHHPNPEVFTELSLIATQRLKLALGHCVVAAYTNVGNGRARCGIVGGSVMLLGGTVAPLALNFLHGSSRWGRLASIPGFFIGLTVLIAAYNGVCLMIWVFGDFRQLRKFEIDGSNEKITSPFGKFSFPSDESDIHPPTPALLSPIRSSPSKTVPGPRFRPSLPPICQVDDGLTPPASPLRAHHAISSLNTSHTSLASPVRTYFPPEVPSSARVRHVRIQTPDVASIRSLSPMSFNYCQPVTAAPSRRPSVPDTFVSSRYSMDSGVSSDGDEDQVDHNEGDGFDIEVSEAFIDELPDPVTSTNPGVPVAIAVTATMLHNMEYASGADGDTSFNARSMVSSVPRTTHYQTATFIRPYPQSSPAPGGASMDVEAAHNLPEERFAFDFDGLPPRYGTNSEASHWTKRPSVTGSMISATPTQSLLGRSTQRTSVISFATAPQTPRGGQVSSFNTPECPLPIPTEPGWSVVDFPETTAYAETEKKIPRSLFSRLFRSSSPHPSSTSSGVSAASSVRTLVEGEQPVVASRLHEMLSVPAFKSPLTPILNPVVTRAQWEIVVRSAAIAFLLTLASQAILLPLPISH